MKTRICFAIGAAIVFWACGMHHKPEPYTITDTYYKCSPEADGGCFLAHEILVEK